MLFTTLQPHSVPLTVLHSLCYNEIGLNTVYDNLLVAQDNENFHKLTLLEFLCQLLFLIRDIVFFLGTIFTGFSWDRHFGVIEKKSLDLEYYIMWV